MSSESKHNKKNEHDFKTAGTTLGQLFNTSSYNENYTQKKGMRFFVVMVILIFIACVVFLSIKPYSDIVVMYADESEITIHEVRVTLFGGFRFKDSYVFEYQGEDEKYGRLLGKAAQLAILTRTRKVDLILADRETLLELGLAGYTENHSRYTGSKNSKLLLRHDLFENDFDLLYGLAIPALDYITFTGDAALAITDNIDSKHHSQKEWTQLVRFIDKLYEGVDYTDGRL